MAPDTTPLRIKAITVTLESDDPESDLDESLELEHQEVAALVPLIRAVLGARLPEEKKIR
jgi:hypothetical protein